MRAACTGLCLAVTVAIECVSFPLFPDCQISGSCCSSLHLPSPSITDQKTRHGRDLEGLWEADYHHQECGSCTWSVTVLHFALLAHVYVLYTIHTCTCTVHYTCTVHVICLEYFMLVFLFKYTFCPTCIQV